MRVGSKVHGAAGGTSRGRADRFQDGWIEVRLQEGGERGVSEVEDRSTARLR
jgi:hypothetical protein